MGRSPSKMPRSKSMQAAPAASFFPPRHHMAILGDYVNGNHRTILYDDGTRFRETGSYVEGKWVADDADHFTFDFPESFDLKITDYCDGGCPWCFPGGTPIQCADGSLAPIEMIRVGDCVNSYDRNNNKVICGMVTEVFKRYYQGDLIGITINGSTIWCTPNHKILTRNRGLVQASDLTTDDDMVTI